MDKDFLSSMYICGAFMLCTGYNSLLYKIRGKI